MKNNLVVNKLSFFVSFLLYVFSFYFITYNSDWVAYEFIDLYRLHIILAGILYALFFSKISPKGYWFVIYLVLLNYVALGNMIRYYVAFPASLCSLLYLYEKRYLKHTLFVLFALMNHSAIIGIYAAIYTTLFMSSQIIKHPYRLLILLNIGVFVCVEFASALLGDHFLAYLDEDMQSSILGGLYNIFPDTVALILTLSMTGEIKNKDMHLYSSNYFQFFFICSISCSIYLLSSIHIQILANRYISPMLISVLSFMILCMRKTSVNYLRISIRRRIILIVFVTLFWEYVVSLVVLKSKFVYDELQIMLTSIILNN